ncbi:MAG: hypothetical protein VYE73_18300 [Acidobacteriota bacterium]|nr:hypothetical protein [Acidobacteriota bacterium]
MSTWRISCTLLLVLAFASSPMFGASERKKAASRAEIDAIAADSLDRLFENRPKARRLYDNASGYAVFSNIKVSLVITGGGGRGVAVTKGGDRTYMKMATGGLNLGLGGQKYQVVFLFEDPQTLDRFINEGWEAEGSANAVAGNKGANVAPTFRNGVALFQMTQGGLMLQVDISGTKYWQSNLNR